MVELAQNLKRLNVDVDAHPNMKKVYLKAIPLVFSKEVVLKKYSVFGTIVGLKVIKKQTRKLKSTRNTYVIAFETQEGALKASETKVKIVRNEYGEHEAITILARLFLSDNQIKAEKKRKREVFEREKRNEIAKSATKPTAVAYFKSSFRGNFHKKNTRKEVNIRFNSDSGLDMELFKRKKIIFKGWVLEMLRRKAEEYNNFLVNAGSQWGPQMGQFGAPQGQGPWF